MPISMDEKESGGYREIPHCADLELEVWGKTLEDLFGQAAKGMLAFIMPDVPEGNRDCVSFSVMAQDYEMLLVDFLTELLFLGDEKELAFVDFDIRITGHTLNATVCGVPAGLQKAEIKAVTYHRLAVRKEDDYWRTRIVFDL